MSETVQESPDSTEAEQSNRLYEIITGLVLLGFTFGIFVIGEAGIRLVQYAKFGLSDSVESSSAFYADEETGIRLIRPNQQLGNVRINNLGYRGPDVSMEKQEDVTRVLFLGSSTTYDANVREEKNWPHLTMTLLQETFPECKFDFVNAGQPGFGTESITTLYESRLRQLGADVAILLPGDINQDLSWMAKEQGIDTVHYRPSWLARSSVLWSKLEKNFRVVELQRAAFSRAGKVALDLPLAQGRFRERLQQLTGMITQDGVSVFVLKIGSLLRPGQDPAIQIRNANTNFFYMPYVALPDLVAARQGYNEVIDELPGVNQSIVLSSGLKPPATRQHYSDTMHFTPLGSKSMAEYTAEELAESSTLRQRLQDTGCLSQ